jgi:hypothetical protein
VVERICPNLPEGAHLGPHDLIAFEDYEKDWLKKAYFT